jgi:carotenoid cleavage dioxygenase-like enzyme
MFETVKEDVEGVEMKVTSGEFPAWLAGTNYNNGFGQFESCPADRDCFSINHLADVMSYYRKVEIANGTVRLWSKIQKTNYWHDAQKSKPTYRTFNGTNPPFTVAETLDTMTHPMKVNDNLNVAILQMTTSGRMFGVSDMKGFNEAQSNLDYAGGLVFKEKKKPLISDLPMFGVDMVTCAHIGNTLGDKYVYGFNYLMIDGAKNDLAVWRVDMTQPDGGVGSKLVREWMDTVKVPGMTHISYIHTFANTANYLVFVGSAFQYNIGKIMTNTNILNAMEWHGEEHNMVWVYEKSTGKFTKTFTADAFWFYHLVNCYEDGTKVVLDINSVDYRHIETAFANEKLRYDYAWEFEEKPTIRLVVDTAAEDGAHFSPEVIGPSFDLGTIHPNLHGQDYQFTWALGWSGEHLWYDNIIKFDVTERKTVATWHKEDHYPGELYAVAKPGGEHEDDVVIMVTMLGGDYGTSYVLALDGRDLTPIAEARSPFPLPFGSHGCWQGTDKSRGCVGETTADPFGKPKQFKKRQPTLALV